MRLASDESATWGGRRVLVLIPRSVHGWQAPLDLIEEVTHRHLEAIRHEGQGRQRGEAVATIHLGYEALRERESQLRLRQAELAAASPDDRAKAS